MRLGGLVSGATAPEVLATGAVAVTTVGGGMVVGGSVVRALFKAGSVDVVGRWGVTSLELAVSVSPIVTVSTSVSVVYPGSRRPQRPSMSSKKMSLLDPENR